MSTLARGSGGAPQLRTRALPCGWKGPKLQETQPRWLLGVWLGLSPLGTPHRSASWQRPRTSHVSGLADSPYHRFPSSATFPCQTQPGKEDPTHSRRKLIPGCLGITQPSLAVGHPRCSSRQAWAAAEAEARRAGLRA